MAILKHTPKAACEILEKLLKSAIANAEANNNMDVSRLYVAKCYVCQGPTLKRLRPRAQGRGFRITRKRRTSPLYSRKWNKREEVKQGPED